MADEEGKTKEYYKQMAMDQRAVLQDLFRSKNRPDPLTEMAKEIYVIAKDVIEKWRAFVR